MRLLWQEEVPPARYASTDRGGGRAREDPTRSVHLETPAEPDARAELDRGLEERTGGDTAPRMPTWKSPLGSDSATGAYRRPALPLQTLRGPTFRVRSILIGTSLSIR